MEVLLLDPGPMLKRSSHDCVLYHPCGQSAFVFVAYQRSFPLFVIIVRHAY